MLPDPWFAEIAVSTRPPTDFVVRAGSRQGAPRTAPRSLRKRNGIDFTQRLLAALTSPDAVVVAFRLPYRLMLHRLARKNRFATVSSATAPRPRTGSLCERSTTRTRQSRGY